MGGKVGRERIHIYFYATVLSLLLRETGLHFVAFHGLQIIKKKKKEKKIKRQEARVRGECGKEQQKPRIPTALCSDQCNNLVA